VFDGADGVLAIWNDIRDGRTDEFEFWFKSEHLAERLAVPGFRLGRRYEAIAGAPRYFVFYLTDTPGVLTSAVYLERLNNPTPWSRKMMPHHRNMVRSLCLVREGYGGGIPTVMATVRLSGKIELPRGKGLTSAHLLESQPMPAQTTEQKIRGRDGTVDWVLLVGGYDESAVTAAAGSGELYRPAYSLSSGEIA
jgi:hypothetical protein